MNTLKVKQAICEMAARSLSKSNRHQPVLVRPVDGDFYEVCIGRGAGESREIFTHEELADLIDLYSGR